MLGKQLPGSTTSSDWDEQFPGLLAWAHWPVGQVTGADRKVNEKGRHRSDSWP